MPESTALFETEHGRDYLTRLCRHFAHKVAVTLEDDRGECRFSCGTAELTALPEGLRVRAEGPTPADLADVQATIESHLLRFAFREGERRLTWS
ncbi:DUF2218 domain-containing protein [Azospirillum halopraeferens]|uniref:DUF2218 domain-containing protein n=1 Tax=Azospirillum halopraeferens TaxID=34010 RepID=UPI000405DFCA|nr:DUF2218 domain-containing protein [Azospirillum halopraeferens]